MRIKNRKRIIRIICCLIFNLVFLSGFAYADSLPKKYDLRQLERVTPVKDQGEINSCWAFAALSSLESNIKFKKNKEYDFSENNMINVHGFDSGAKDGGNVAMATAYLASWKGAVLEEKDPYPKNRYATNRGIKKSDYHIKNVIYIPQRKTFDDNDKIKKAIMDYGAVYTVFKWDESYYNQRNSSYSYNSLSKGNHAVSIVGWDDDYSKDKFKHKPDGDGAFICRNSAGSNWGDDGYFYVSYYDSNIGKIENAAFVASDEKYDNIYQYDELGQTYDYGCSDETAWFSNVFVAKENENLSAVGFYTNGEDSDYEVWICRNFEDINSFKDMQKINQGKINNVGYHTISTDKINLNKDEKFAIIIKLKTKAEKYPVAVESPKGKISSKAKANKNESFISINGKEWSDLTDIEPNSNVCLKAITKNRYIVQKQGNLEIQLIEKNDSVVDEGQVDIKVRIRNNEGKPKNVTLMLALYDENNKMVDSTRINKEIKSKEEELLTTGVCIPDKEEYILKGFVWDDSDNGNLITKNPIQINIK
ncbi:C1 family peptidase [Tepidibacter mesophilus]|uniref:lectin like domain-containing protein n=1 Tax=Tepidibacter mesophilus TaxID=655607 RepID=UPI001650F530|nr:lectin like domain-containing protein [Tepidibacter mesophilus]